MYFGQEFVVGLVFPKVQRIKAGSRIIVRIFCLQLLVINQSEIEFSVVATLGEGA